MNNTHVLIKIRGPAGAYNTMGHGDLHIREAWEINKGKRNRGINHEGDITEASLK